MNNRYIFKIIVNVLMRILPGNIFLYIYFYFSYIINHLTVYRVANRERIKQLRDFNYKSYKTSDTLFILGSGSSIKEFTQEQWDIIKKHDSVGFNFWLIHDFVPTFYVFEENTDSSRNEAFYRLLDEKKDIYSNTPFIAKDVEVKGINVDKIPNVLKDNLYLSTDLVIPEENKEQFKKHLKYYVSFMRKINKSRLKVTIKKRATLSYLLLLASEMHYKNIVLCGVDLNNSKFFYFGNKYKDRTKPERDLVENHIHPTNQKTNNNIPISEIIEVIQDEIFTKENIKVTVGSKNSALYPRFEYYFKTINEKGAIKGVIK